MTAKVVLQALEQVWVNLGPLHQPMAVMGGLAVAVWKHPRATRDVDVLVGLQSVDADTILQALERAGLRRRKPQPVLQVGPNRFLQLSCAPTGTFLDIPVDVLFADSAYQQQALDRRVSTRVPGLDNEIFVLSCEDLIVHKLLAGRILDRADVAALLRANRATLDFPYLLDWVSQLGVAAELAEAWAEAFPGEETPGAR